MKLYVMVGIPSSGKTTWARKNLKHCVYVATDDIRVELFGNAAFTTHHWKVFDIAYQRVVDALRAGKDVVYDATNIRPKERLMILRHVARQGIKCEAIAVVRDVTPEKAIEMQKGRPRKVPDPVIRQFHGMFVPPSPREGFTSIQYV